MSENDRRPALAGGIGAGVGVGVAAVIDQLFAIPFLTKLATAGTVSVVVAVGLFLVLRN